MAQFCSVLTSFTGDERVWAVTFSSVADLLMNKIPTPLSQWDLEIITIFLKINSKNFNSYLSYGLLSQISFLYEVRLK